MSEAPDLNRSFGLLLADMVRLVRRDFSQRAQRIGLTQSQWRVLAYLSRNEGLTQAALADILEMQPISLARLLDRMVAAGWIERRNSPTDRRAYQLFLTPESAPLMEQIKEIGIATRERALTGLDPEQRELLTDFLLQVKTNLQNPVTVAGVAEVTTDLSSDVV